MARSTKGLAVEIGDSSPPLSFEPSAAERLVNAALADCASRSFGGNTAQVCDALKQGRCDVCRGFNDHLTYHIGQYLSQVDRNLKAVVRYEPEPASLNPKAAQRQPAGQRGGINLIAWVDRKSAALTSLGSTLETSLAEARKKLGCPNALPTCFNLDLQMVDDREVAEARGYGLVVKQPFLRSVQVWRRVDVPDANPLGSLDELTALDRELAPEEVLFEQARAIEKRPSAERLQLEPRLRELKVILIRRLISDQLAYINIAKDWLTLADLEEVYNRRIGNGKIGGKAAGLVLARRILGETLDETQRAGIRFPESYFLGSDQIYIFMAMNGLMHWNNQKYKPEDQIYSEYPQICEQFERGALPPEVLERLRGILTAVGSNPLIARSSSQLEDNFGTSFAGKYQSFFCPNQGTPEENLEALRRAIALTYASTLNPDALLYRRSKGLQDYDERMAVILQVVQGERFGRYYFPFAAGVAFSHNLYRWAPQIRREDGFARLVWGLGTHAVERGGNDYPRLIALSHPTLQPDDDPQAVRYYSQKYLDVIDLEDNAFKNLAVRDLLSPRYPPLRYLVQVECDGYFSTPRTRIMEDDVPGCAITFDELLRRTPFATNLSRLLKTLEEHYRVPVDVEFTVGLSELSALRPTLQITLLQCRPQSQMQTVTPELSPGDLEPASVVFSTHFMVPPGYLGDVRHVLYVNPEKYFGLPTPAERNELHRLIEQLNTLLPPKTFILVGPGRWGSTNPDLGVFVNYADVFNAGALVELAGACIGVAPEPSFGTHFFQDLMEAQIYPLAVSLDDRKTVFNRAFFEESPNHLEEHVKASWRVAEAVRLIAVADYRPGSHLELFLDGDKNYAVACVMPDK
jgi:hypothetical protein